MNAGGSAPATIVPILLYDGGCAVCRRIGRWVSASASGNPGGSGIIARPVGDDPASLRRLNPGLDIWDAYAVVHVIMPDGSMKTGGEAVAEVLRRLPATRWFTGCLAVEVFGVRPFQAMLNLAYRVLDDVRPLLGCDSCGRSRPWVRPVERLVAWMRSRRGSAPTSDSGPHVTPRSDLRPGVAQPDVR